MYLAAMLGFVFGWLGSVPVAGPISALVITRGIQGRFRAGAYIALGGGAVEAGYAALAFWGFSTLLADYPVIVPLSRAGGAIVMLALGISFLRKEPEEPQADAVPRDSATGSFFLGASLCALNPTLIATWTAVVTTLYSLEVIDFQGASALPFAMGTAIGIAGWFLLLLWIIRRYKDRFSHMALARVVRVIGGALILVSFWFAARFVQYWMA